MEDGDEEVLYQIELVQLFSEEDEVYIKWPRMAPKGYIKLVTH